VGGSFGTLSELALAAKLGKPVISLRSWELSIEGRPAAIPSAQTVEEAVVRLMELISAADVRVT
jgi:hypothetical protein